MKKEEVFDAFCRLFSDLASEVVSYEKKGSRTIAVVFKDGRSLIFLYFSDDNWNLGTKMWRHRPESGKGDKKDEIV